MSTSAGRPSRLTAGVYATVAVTLVVAVVAMAYGTAAPILGVAEFAPAARQTVDPPPTTAAEQAAVGRGGAARRSTTTTTAAVPASTTDAVAGTMPPTTRVARSRTCVGDPPRQIEDPMSPPCMASIFEGDNGGATSTGVTATEIRIAFPTDGWCSGEQCTSMFNALFEFFNQRFEFYGRQLRPVFVNGPHGNPPQARALADQVAAQQVFGAAAFGVEWNNVDQAIFQELARQGVVTAMRGTNASDRTLLDELHPYLWSVQPSSEQWQANMGDFACGALAGRPASHAGTDALRAQTRKFGVLAMGKAATPSSRPLTDALQQCGIRPEVVSWTSEAGSASLRTGLEAFRAAGVTTMTCVCTGYLAGSTLSGAMPSGYLPEVLTPMYSEPSEESWSSKVFRNQLFGITARPRLLPLQAQPWYQAMVAMAPELLAKLDYNSTFGTKGTYEQLLLLAAGVQGAGPNLTPETFAAALMSMKFPNANAGAAPYWQPSVGFGPGDHSFISDFAVSWWNDTAPALEVLSSRPGSWCYLGQGARWSVGHYPTDADARLFVEQPCR